MVCSTSIYPGLSSVSSYNISFTFYLQKSERGIHKNKQQQNNMCILKEKKWIGRGGEKKGNATYMLNYVLEELQHRLKL